MAPLLHPSPSYSGVRVPCSSYIHSFGHPAIFTFVIYPQSVLTYHPGLSHRHLCLDNCSCLPGFIPSLPPQSIVTVSTGVHILKCASSDHVSAAPTLPCLSLLRSHPSPFHESAYSPSPLLLPGLPAWGLFTWLILFAQTSPSSSYLKLSPSP